MIRYVLDFLRVASLPCSRQTELISRRLDGGLSPGEERGVRFHLLYCRGCARFRAQIEKLRDLLRSDAAALDSGSPMPESVRSRVRASLAARGENNSESL